MIRSKKDKKQTKEEKEKDKEKDKEREKELKKHQKEEEKKERKADRDKEEKREVESKKGLPHSPVVDTTYLRSFRKGYVEMRYRNSWKYIYVILIGGSFYMYHNSTDAEPFNSILLSKSLYKEKDSEVQGISLLTENVKDINRPHYFALVKEKKEDKGNEEKKKSLQDMYEQKFIPEEVYQKKLAEITDTGPEILFIGSFPGAIELRLWKDDILKAINQNIEPAPKSICSSSDKTNKKIAKSKGSSHQIKYTIDNETQQILNSLKFLVNIDKGQKRSEQLEKNLGKLTIKSFALIGTRQIKPEEFAATDKLMKNVFEFLVKMYNAKKLVQKEAIMSKALEKVEQLLKESEKNLLKIFDAYPKEKQLLSQIFSEFNIQFFQKVLFDSTNNADIQKHVEKMVDAMGKYTQFQYNS